MNHKNHMFVYNLQFPTYSCAKRRNVDPEPEFKLKTVHSIQVYNFLQYNNCVNEKFCVLKAF